MTKKQLKAMRREAKLEKKENEKKRNNFVKNIWILFIFVILLLYIGVNISEKYADESKMIVHSKGSENAKLQLIEYSDFECPACSLYHKVVDEVIKEYKNDLNLTFNHFPLRSIHKKAQIAAQVSEAAGFQNKFWEMHDLLFINQEDWSSSNSYEAKFIEYAQELNLNIDQFKKDYKSNKARKIVNSHYDKALENGINSTPTFILNGEKIKMKPDLESFKEVLEKTLNEK